MLTTARTSFDGCDAHGSRLAGLHCTVVALPIRERQAKETHLHLAWGEMSTIAVRVH